MTVALSGANGFTGRFVCTELQRRKIPFVALLRPGSDDSWVAAREIPVRLSTSRMLPGWQSSCAIAERC